MSDETGQGNELESLKYVLNEYISINDLKSKIDIIDSNALNYYQSRITGWDFAWRVQDKTQYWRILSGAVDSG